MIKKEIEGAALLSIYNELKDEIKAIRTDIQHLYIPFLYVIQCNI